MSGTPTADKLWELLLELRKELLLAQKTRAQVIGFKITFVTAAVGLIGTKLEGDLDPIVLVVPAFAAIFFDLLVASYSFSIKRIGTYIRCHLDPALLKYGQLPPDLLPSEQFLCADVTKQKYALYGNFGLTVIIVVVGVTSTFFPFRFWLPTPVLCLLALFTIVDVLASRSPLRLTQLSEPQ